ncbi:class I SAM-dependent methyltransferase [Eggerthia catenaformis]|uniref:class I SAM-dependent methyltransferase n=1 Tax=Eggerthia catenaformis TaxID=31973 RepID=UPI00047C337A|nr:class I SAM-dependent methyltransferase [Eggerthia catenaformis]
MKFLNKLLNNTGKPEGFLGKIMIKGMNKGHKKVSDWGMSYLDNIHPDEILELGCGGGRNAHELLKKYPSAHLTAIDYSPLSIEKTKVYNLDAVTKGNMDVEIGDVNHLSIASNTIDLVTAFETIYFWKDLPCCFKLIHKTLTDNGCFLIVNESDGEDRVSLRYEKIIEGMENYTVKQLYQYLKEAGFSHVEALHHESKPWITIIAHK